MRLRRSVEVSVCELRFILSLEFAARVEGDLEDDRRGVFFSALTR